MVCGSPSARWAGPFAVERGWPAEQPLQRIRDSPGRPEILRFETNHSGPLNRGPAATF